MEKTLFITIMVDDVPLAALENLRINLDKLLEEYPNKRINIQIQDEPVVRTSLSR